MIFKGQILSDEEKRIIHKDSLRILEEVGVKFPSEKALAILEKGGAKIDWDKQVAHITGDMVKNALSTAPKEFTLGGRNSDNNFFMPSLYSAYNLDGCGVNMIDFKTGKRREAVLQDIADAARVFEEIELGKVLWPPLSPSDVEKGPRSIISTGTAFLNTSKHVQDEVKSIKEVKYVIEMAKAILGSQQQVIDRKIYSVTYCTVAPLSHDCEMMEATMELTKYKAPVLMYPMPACGSTGPASLYSNIATANAEILSSTVLLQLTTPETPLIYGAALGVINMRSGIFLEGAAETALQLGAMGEMGKYYNLPTIVAGCLTDAKEPGMQSVMEKLLTTMPLVMVGVDVVQGIGLIESSMTMSLEHIVIDSEIANICRRMKEGVHVCQEKNYFEDIKAVGQEGHFLKQKSTKTAFRSSEFFTPNLTDRGSYDEWLSLGSPSMLSKAHEKVEKILNDEMKNPLDQGTEKILKEIMEDARRNL